MNLEDEPLLLFSDGRRVRAFYEDENDDSFSEEDKDNSLHRNPFQKDTTLSLEKICLKSIVKNFEKFNVAFSTTKNISLRRNLEFLQRKYSLHMLLEAPCNDSSLNFVLNEHLRELNFRYLFRCSSQAILKRLSEIGHGVTTVTMGEKRFPILSYSDSFVKQAIIHLPNVNVLHIFHGANDDLLKLISSCSNLTELLLDGSDITDKGVKSLCNKRDNTVPMECSLKTLLLLDTKVTKVGIAFLLRNIPSLEVLHHPNLPTILYSIHKKDMLNNTLNTARKYNLTSLHFSYTSVTKIKNISDILQVCIKVCPKIRTLHVPFGKENHLDLIAQFAELEKLSLACLLDNKPYLDLNLLAVLSGKLKELKICRASFSVSSLIQNCPNLVSLDLIGASFVCGQDVANTNKLNNLQELQLLDVMFTESPTERSVNILLNCSPKLERLFITQCEMATSEICTGFTNFCAKNTIRKLSLKYLDIPASVLENILLTCSSLETLNIEDCEYIDVEQIANLHAIACSKKNQVDIIWNEYEWELFSPHNSQDEIDNDFYDSDVYPYDSQVYPYDSDVYPYDSDGDPYDFYDDWYENVYSIDYDDYY